MVAKEQLISEQTTHIVGMRRPIHFGYNPETGKDNKYQHMLPGETGRSVRKKALGEYDGMVEQLTESGIVVFQLPTRRGIKTPDGVFPNNGFSLDSYGPGRSKGTLVLYPMYAPNRRAERQTDELLRSLKGLGMEPYVYDLTNHEQEEDGNARALEGTGSMVLDRVNKNAFAVESLRTHRTVFNEWVDKMDYTPFFARAADTENPPYHTNVILSVGKNYAVVCPEVIDERDRPEFLGRLKDTKKDVIEITQGQVASFCGNILEVQTTQGDPRIVMSNSAYGGFTEIQRAKLERHGGLVPVEIDTIEKVGGGSARCMLAEIFLPVQNQQKAA